VDFRATFEANSKATELMEPREGAFDHPTMFTQPTSVGRSSLGDEGMDTTDSQALAMRFGVVGAVRVEAVGTTARTANVASNGLDPIHQGDQLCHVVAIGPREGGVQRDPLPFDHEMVFRPRTSSIGRIRPRRPPFPTARMLEESAEALFQSSRSAPLSLSSRTWWSLSHTPAWCQSRSRRQQVIPEPQPISRGRSSQGMPVLRTKRIPVRHFRFSTGLRPGFLLRRGLGGGRSGSMMAQSSSSRMGRAMGTPPLSILRGGLWQILGGFERSFC